MFGIFGRVFGGLFSRLFYGLDRLRDLRFGVRRQRLFHLFGERIVLTSSQVIKSGQLVEVRPGRFINFEGREASLAHESRRLAKVSLRRLHVLEIILAEAEIKVSLRLWRFSSR